jgi:probable F420-dependent oxidoreductase
VTSLPARRKFRFGVTGRGRTMVEWRDFAKKAEALGYSTLVLPDHFTHQLSPMPALAAAAQATSDLRLATLVLDNDFRHPAVLAKEAATIDVLSDGRFELGIGTGSLPADNQRTGMPLDPPAVRVDRLIETIEVLKQCFTQEVVHFEGKHYRLEDLPAYPRPVQQPHMPILVAARGPRMLRLAGREADIVAIMSSSGEDRRDRLNIVAQAAGERFAGLELNTLYMRVQVDGKPSDAGPQYNMPDLIGSRDQIIEHLVGQREQHGVSYIVVIGDAIDAFAPVVARLAGT